MATTKKSVAKTKKVAPQRTTPARKRAAKVSRKSTKPMRSLHVSRPNKPFMTFALTEQTIYWVVILLMVIGIVAYVIHTEDKINAIYDQIDANTAQLESLPNDMPSKKIKGTN